MLPRFLSAVFADVVHAPRHPAGWATDSLVRSLRRVVLRFAAGWHVVMLWAAWSSLEGDAWAIMLAQACVAIGALVGVRRPIPDPLIPLAMVVLGLWCYLASGDVGSTLVFAACWEVNFASFVAGVMILRRYALPLVLGTAVVISITLAWALPEWGVQLPASVTLTQICIIVAMRWGVGRLLRAASEADRAAAEAEEARRRARVTAHLSMTMAEDSRALHDTAINTLGAIATGGAGTTDELRVRDRCARDVALLRALRSERSQTDQVRLGDIFVQPGLPVRRRGLDDASIARLDEILPAATTSAIVGCVREAVTNATKHSGADHVEVAAARSETTLTVNVRDLGVGFADVGEADRGIRASIIDRAGDHGFAAEVRSRPGEGTTVALTVPVHDNVADARAEHVDATRTPIEVLHGRAGELWALGVTAVSLALTVGGATNRFLALYPMIGIMLLAWAVFRFWPSTRDRAALRVLLVVFTCAVFFLAAAATSFGAEGAVHLQALAPTGAFVLLLSSSPVRRVAMVGGATWMLLVVAVATAATAAQSATAGEIVLIAGGVGLGFSGVWAAFRTQFARLAEGAARSQQDTFDATMRSELDAAAQTGHRRWLGAGLDTAIELLCDIAEGRRAADSDDTRSACDEEERYLRQLVQLSPEFVHLSGELMPTLRHARDRRIAFVLKMGGVDAPDKETAREIAAALTRCLSGMAPGEPLTASLFPVADGLQLTLIGAGVEPGLDAHSALSVRSHRLGAVDLVEVTYSRVGDTTGARVP